MKDRDCILSTDYGLGISKLETTFFSLTVSIVQVYQIPRVLLNVGEPCARRFSAQTLCHPVIKDLNMNRSTLYDEEPYQTH